jgi:hypothetical protein
VQTRLQLLSFAAQCGDSRIRELNPTNGPAAILLNINQHFWESRGRSSKIFQLPEVKKKFNNLSNYCFPETESMFGICRFFFRFLRLIILDAGKIAKLCDQYSDLLPGSLHLLKQSLIIIVCAAGCTSVPAWKVSNAIIIKLV